MYAIFTYRFIWKDTSTHLQNTTIQMTRESYSKDSDIRHLPQTMIHRGSRLQILHYTDVQQFSQATNRHLWAHKSMHTHLQINMTNLFIMFATVINL